jgi:hypothetical protein
VDERRAAFGFRSAAVLGAISIEQADPFLSFFERFDTAFRGDDGSDLRVRRTFRQEIVAVSAA